MRSSDDRDYGARNDMSLPPYAEGGMKETLGPPGEDLFSMEAPSRDHRSDRSFGLRLFLSSTDPLATTDLRGIITDVNPAFEQITGFGRSHLVGQRLSACFVEEAEARLCYETVLVQGLLKGYPLTARHRLERVTAVLCGASLYCGADGAAEGIFVTLHDVTEEKRIEGERTRLAAVVEQADEIVVVTDPGWRIRYVNPAFERKTGFTRQELLGKGIAILGNGQEQHMFYRPIRSSLKRGQVWAGRRTARKKDGSLYEVDVTMSPIREEKGEIGGYVAVARDITERLKLEEQLRQSQKMEAIGTLAGGIAHDFNNILAGIIGFTEMALDDLTEGSVVAKNLRYVLKGATRGRDLVKQIIAFSRTGGVEKRLIHAGPVVEETAKLLRASLPSTIELPLTIRTSSDLIYAEATHIQQILINLATNSAQAIGETGGVIRIDVADSQVLPESAPVQNMVPGEYVVLSVKDNGSGMTSHVMARIFEPFFTTKTACRGTGLGLAVVFGIVKGLRGSIAVESEPGEGSLFRIFLPKAAAVAEQARPADVPTLRGSERILFVDDEETLGEWAKSALERLGYRVESIRDSLSALTLFLSNPYEFDLIISDHAMPRLTGKQLYREARKVRPRMPFILCTGYHDTISAAAMVAEGIGEILVKPLSKKELAEAIRRVLDKELPDS